MGDAALSADVAPTTTESRGLPVNANVAFTDSRGNHKPSLEKRQRRLVKTVLPIEPLLDEDEGILIVTTAVSPTSFLEKLLTGMQIVYANRCLLVFTNKRMFHIPTSRTYKFRNSIAQIEYGACTTFDLTGHKLVIKGQDGPKETFLYIDRRERRKLKSIMEAGLMERLQPRHTRRVHLCPRCGHALKKQEHNCGHCRLEFKSRDKARNLSMLLPGGGYFYTRRPYLGLIGFLVEAVLIFFVVALAIKFANGDTQILPALVILSALLILEKIVTVNHATRYVDEFVPKDKALAPITGPV